MAGEDAEGWVVVCMRTPLNAGVTGLSKANADAGNRPSALEKRTTVMVYRQKFSKIEELAASVLFISFSLNLFFSRRPHPGPMPTASSVRLGATKAVLRVRGVAGFSAWLPSRNTLTTS